MGCPALCLTWSTFLCASRAGPGIALPCWQQGHILSYFQFHRLSVILLHIRLFHWHSADQPKGGGGGAASPH